MSISHNPTAKRYDVYTVYTYDPDDGELHEYAEYAYYGQGASMCEALEDSGVECELIQNVYSLLPEEIH